MIGNDNLPPALREAADALDQQRPDLAEPVLRRHLEGHPRDPNALRMLAEVAIRFECFGDAELLLEQCLGVAPDFAAARHRYASLLLQLNKPHRALEELDLLLAGDPGNFECGMLKAAALARIGETEKALTLHREQLNLHPERPAVWLGYAADLTAAGKREDSIRLYRQALERFPDLAEAWWGLSNLKTYRFSPQETAAMNAALAKPHLSERERCLLHFALGKAAENQNDFPAAFRHYAEANTLQRKAVRYDADRNSAFFASLRNTFSGDFLARHQGSGCKAPDPIFIVGLARSGSTLVEQILSSHSQVEATMELPNITAILERLDGPYPEVLAELDPDVFEALGEEYIEDTRAFRRGGHAFFIDKMPENFRHVGLIHLILPNARIIDVRRHPLAAGVSLYRQDFENDYAYSYDLNEIGRYYRDYVALMDHFDRLLPGRIHRVFYERLVADLEGEARSLLEYLGLPFEESCLKFHENRRIVRTASAEQVRRPIFTDAVDEWRHFEPWLSPLMAALGDVATCYPGVPQGMK